MAARISHTSTTMGEQTVFDLNEHIAQWRGALARSETLANSDLDELEGHLREEIQNLRASGLSEEEAFLVARHRLGTTCALAEEYAKVNRAAVFRGHCFWAAAVLFGYEVARLVGSAASSLAVFLAGAVGIRGYRLTAVEAIVQALSFGAVILILYVIVRRHHTLGESFSRMACSLRGKLFLFAGALVVIVVALAGHFLATAAAVRVLGARESGALALLGRYRGLVWIVVVPLILLAVVIKLRPRGTAGAEL